MEKAQGVNILVLVLLSLILIAICLQNGGGGVIDEKVKSAVEEILRKVRLLAMSPSMDTDQWVLQKSRFKGCPCNINLKKKEIQYVNAQSGNIA